MKIRRNRKSLTIALITFRQELKSIFTDAGALLILFGASVVYPIAYSIAYKNNVVRDIPVAVVDLDKTSSSRQLSRMINATDKINVTCKPGSLKEAEALFWENNVKGIVLIPEDFEKNILKGEQSDMGLYCDASYFLVYKETLAGAIQASGTFSAGVEIKRLMASGSSIEQATQLREPVQSKFFMLYNPSGAYGSFVMPGLLIVILQQTLLIGIGMINGASREKNNKLLIPGLHLKRGVIFSILGKSLAYFVVALLTSTFTLVWIYDWFDFVNKGNMLNVFCLIILYGFSTIFLGLAISFLFHKREQSIMFLVFLSPIVLFISGISWPFSAMPVFLQKISFLIPSTSMVPAYLRIRTMGVSLADVKYEVITLCILTVVYFIAAVASYTIMRERQYRKTKLLV